MENATIGSWIRKIVGSLFFIGYLPASGTVASGLTVAFLWYVTNYKIGPFQAPLEASSYWLIALAAVGCSFYFSSGGRAIYGKEDARQIVIDEVAGQLITFLFVPLTLRTLIAGFFLFRFFDIVKPFPVHNMEAIEDGVGVTMDDVVAGVLANISLLLILAGYHAVKGYL